jgi:hypothetical protein
MSEKDLQIARCKIEKPFYADFAGSPGAVSIGNPYKLDNCKYATDLKKETQSPRLALDCLDHLSGIAHRRFVGANLCVCPIRS